MDAAKTPQRPSRLGIALAVVPLLLNVALVYVLTRIVSEEESSLTRQVRARAIFSQSSAIAKLFYDAGTAMGGYSITRGDNFMKRYESLKNQIPASIKELKKLVVDDPKQVAIVTDIECYANDGFTILEDAKRAIDENKVDIAQMKARHMYKSIREITDKIQSRVGSMDCNPQVASDLPSIGLPHFRAFVNSAVAVSVVLNTSIFAILGFYFGRSRQKVPV